MRLSIVVPVHNEEEILRATTLALIDLLQSFPGSQVILVENASTDRSPQQVESLAVELTTDRVAVIPGTSPKGYGSACKQGMRIATGDLIVLTAADLPFGFSDVESYQKCTQPPPMAIGSKAHRDSVVESPPTRKILSAGFRLVRRVVLGMRVGDSQGTILMTSSTAKVLLPYLEAEDYFLSTEVIAVAGWLGIEAVELPIIYANPRPESKVRPLQDGWSMLKATLRLRARLRSLPTPSDQSLAAAKPARR